MLDTSFSLHDISLFSLFGLIIIFCFFSLQKINNFLPSTNPFFIRLNYKVSPYSLYRILIWVNLVSNFLVLCQFNPCRYPLDGKSWCGKLNNKNYFPLPTILPRHIIKKNQIKTKTREIPPTTHLHLLSLKSIILVHTTSIKNQDIPCLEIIHRYPGTGLSSKQRRQAFLGPLYINTPRKTSPYKVGLINSTKNKLTF